VKLRAEAFLVKASEDAAVIRAMSL